jgi:Arc/MetJ-type ribon-helix-helix transcriptional regulator
MAKNKSSSTAPVTFDLPEDLLSKIELVMKKKGFNSISEVIRAALYDCDFNSYKKDEKDHKQISVRLSDKQRSTLKRYSKSKGASVGELLRVAIDEMSLKGPSRS